MFLEVSGNAAAVEKAITSPSEPSLTKFATQTKFACDIDADKYFYIVATQPRIMSVQARARKVS